ncbi:acyl-CoA dehydrogenase family protein [Micromonospora craniellae]|uniref:Acyl-CoA dehydrogenase n=1 Tax=Micromonospora craniellae TaxID=2294034 RepID=A0A372G0V6_9ACTN|nr:acyl-CoA dehydrogenase family protein [Micromonospora craniellae]QOC91701.1 acyl-CoA/acyl-ACP dehydrogenase [Micromonospora craniellae]RFS46623.1 acyl-CoA dehydrogenase [Micromonospora craniellae]
MSNSAKVLDRAERIAEEVLFPVAEEVDAADTVPGTHLDLLAAEGFYGLAGPPQFSEMAAEETATAARALEIIASGCLTTAFVWAQHHSAVMAATHSQRPGITDQWLEPLCRGERRAGLAILSATRPGPPAVRAEAVDGGWLLHGATSWVTGWGLVDTLFTAARDASDTLVWSLLDATESDTLSVTPVDMVAVAASRTVQVTFTGHFVPEQRVTGTVPHEVYLQRDPATLRFNGSLPLGVATRCARLIGPSPLDAAIDECRATLDAAGPDELPSARGAAAALALRAAGLLATTTGSAAVLRHRPAERLMREALFLLVFGTRPGIRADLIDRLHRG